MYSYRMKELRNLALLSQEDMGKHLNMDESTYRNYESEYYIMPIKHLNNFCNYFDVSLDYLFEITNKKQYANVKKDINKNNSGKLLKIFRKENKLMQEDLANILNVSRPVISNYERGINLIATPFLYQICSRYKISADYLLGKTDFPKYLK